ncbi:peptide ABC transporter substrate-binding protein [Dethiosulfatarculus sandiegensis]|uniref:Peptide ABC transporter substrate-binding protein n=1 Tax=Dethiosulfatarculus sandiegensis TaxID=1429043 RepID=A0A0D2IXU7_9BACT|nr:peptide ABC transporter substrate-binding protein [Dethiosulfatarculus sandiegensis]
MLKVEDLKVHFPIKKGLLSKTVGKVHAVDGVNFELKAGETLGIVGESGCGKTTTGMATINLLKPTSGRVLYQGRDMASLDKQELRDLCKEMQIIFQDPYSSLNPRMVVRRILGDPMRLHGIARGKELDERVDYLMEKVGLTPEQAGRYPHEFSGGQRQRIGIARALTLKPKVIIGDEPVSALDVSIQAQIVNLLIDLQKEFGLSYVIIAHDLAVVEYLCDRIAVMYLGKVVEMTDYKNLYTCPKHPYTQALLSAVPSSHPNVEKTRILLEGDVPSPINPPSGCSFHPRCPKRMEICEKVRPEIKETGTGHTVACHLY